MEFRVQEDAAELIRIPASVSGNRRWQVLELSDELRRFGAAGSVVFAPP
jgi:hypothetical protein